MCQITVIILAEMHHVFLQHGGFELVKFVKWFAGYFNS